MLIPPPAPREFATSRGITIMKDQITTFAKMTIAFATQVDDVVAAGPDHPIRVVRAPASGEPAPYVMVRLGLEALIDRKSFYRLVDIGETEEGDGVAQFGLWSGGAFFPVIPAAELDGLATS